MITKPHPSTARPGTKLRQHTLAIALDVGCAWMWVKAKTRQVKLVKSTNAKRMSNESHATVGYSSDADHRPLKGETR